MNSFISIQLCYLIRDGYQVFTPHTHTHQTKTVFQPLWASASTLGRCQIKCYQPTDRFTVPQLTLKMNKILPWALKSLSDPLLMTLPVTGLLSELVFNHRQAMTSEVWRWACQQVLGEGWLMLSATEKSREQSPSIPDSLQPASRWASMDWSGSLAGPKPHVHTGLLKGPSASHQSSKGRFNLKKSALPAGFQASAQWQSNFRKRVLTIRVYIFLFLPNKSLWSPGGKQENLSDYRKLSEEVIQSSDCGNQQRAGCSSKKMSFPANKELSSGSNTCADPLPKFSSLPPPAKGKKWT